MNRMECPISSLISFAPKILVISFLFIFSIVSLIRNPNGVLCSLGLLVALLSSSLCAELA